MNDNLAYREERNIELIGGEVVAMSPSPVWNHMAVSGNIYGIFRDYLKGKKCTPIQDGFDLHLSEEDVFIPDMMVVCDPDKIRPDGVHGAPDLVVEVLSPSTAKNDRTRKKDVYARCGVREYWLVSPAEESVEVYLPEEGRFALRDVYTYQPWTKEVQTEEEQAEAVTHFRCSLYDDFDISLEDIFKGLLP